MAEVRDKLYFVTDAHLGSGPDSAGRERELCALLERIGADCKVLVLLGDMFDYLATECGVVMHDEPEVMHFDGKTFLVGHGDGLGHLDCGFDLMRRVFRSRLNQRLFALLPAGLTFPFARRWSDSNKRKHERQDSLHYLGDDREGIVLYCRERLQRERFDYCVFGHRHTPLTMPLDDRCTYVNVGDWLNNRNYAVYTPATGTLTLHDYRDQLS